MRPGRWLYAATFALVCGVACAGTETGNPGRRACGAPIVLEFPNGAMRSPPLSSIVVDTREVTCTPDGSSVRCELSEEFYGVPDTYALTLEVGGLEPIELQVELPASSECCACAYDAVTVRVELPDATEG